MSMAREHVHIICQTYESGVEESYVAGELHSCSSLERSPEGARCEDRMVGGATDGWVTDLPST